MPLICFDELTHFSASSSRYMVSRNRSMSGVGPYTRATCNPDADSWVAELISWWIDQDTGLPIPERAGVLRTTDVAEPIRVLILRGRPSRMLDWW
ncbi:terminase large subunit domain-containing protein [Sinorhizobium meliloti]|uniref:terminase large subunit domain-containing protein n=3 Tax=Sinorhizobium/Ensifer group TaxID=227292 RepID=UPI002D787A3C|nr:terminase family protein [Sinorhizobium meliloti]